MSRHCRIPLRPRSAALALPLALAIGLGSGSGRPAVAQQQASQARPSAANASAGGGANPRVLSVFHKTRNFRIPYKVAPADRLKLKEVQLWASDDSGFSWKLVSRTTPDRGVFNFRSPRDGEYWFAVRTLDKQGVLVPSGDTKVEPSMKVTVDTTLPTIVLEPDRRKGNLISVRWEVKDDHLDLNTLVIEYLVDNGQDWRQVPIRRHAYIGSESWDAHTSEPLKVRASISDLAGNLNQAEIALADGSPTNPTLTSNDSPEYSPPPISQISDPSMAFSEDDGAPPSLNQLLPKFSESPGVSGAGHDREEGVFAGASPSQSAAPQQPAQPRTAPPPTVVANPTPSGSAGASIPDEPDPFGGPAVEGTGGANPVAIKGNSGQTLLVSNPNCAIEYAVEDAGPGGPAVVELWVSPDAGRNWIRKGEDPDKTSPFQVDLGGDGTFGLRLVARGASGLGDLPPAPGDAPEMWVEVDRTPPTLQLLPPIVGGGANLGKVAVRWRASDLHLTTKPITVFWRPDQSGSAWQPITEQPIENTGKFIWSVPTTIPPKFHLKVSAVDTVGNTGSVETNEGEAVIVDRTRPRSRIMGLAPTAQSANGTMR